MTRIIAIANPKGGVGKTTTAVSLAGALAEDNHEVLLIDLDPQAHLSLAMGVNPAKVRRSIVDVLQGAASLYNAVRETRLSGIDILPSRPELVDPLLSMSSETDQIHKAFSRNGGASSPAPAPAAGEARSFLHELSVYDWVLLDCPPSWNRITYNALAIADLMLIPTQPEYFAAYNLKTIMEDIDSLRQHNPRLSYRILITLHQPGNPTHEEIVRQIRATFGPAVFETTIPVDPRLPDSAAAGFPINYFDPQAPSSGLYCALAQELARRAEGT